ncbi:MAG: hypothetical protein R3F11_30415 [Verrucomicrobiales bacterium]
MIILATSAPSFGQGGPEGLYRLQSLGGGGGRPWELTGNLDGVPVKKFGRIKLTDTQTGPGAVILKEDGTADVKWKHRIHIGYDYQPDYYQQPPWLPDNSCTEIGWDYENYYPLVGGDRILPFNDLVVEFDTEGTGTWSGASLNVTCDSTCNVTVKYKPENSMQLQSETFTANVTGVLVNASMTGLPDYAEVKVDMLKTFIQQLANQHLTGDRYLAVEDALRNGLDRVTPSYPCGPSGGEFINKVVKNWSYDSTTITCSPTDGGSSRFTKSITSSMCPRRMAFSSWGIGVAPMAFRKSSFATTATPTAPRWSRATRRSAPLTTKGPRRWWRRTSSAMAAWCSRCRSPSSKCPSLRGPRQRVRGIRAPECATGVLRWTGRSRWRRRARSQMPRS